MRRFIVSAVSLLLVWGFAPLALQADPPSPPNDGLAAGTVRGRVTDKATGAGVPGAQVMVVGTRIGTVADDQGRYVIIQVPAGSQTVTVRMLGFAPESRTVSVTESGDVTADFALTKAATQLGEVVVTATGDQRRVEIGNTIATLKVDSIVAAAPVTSVGELLQGRVAGLMTFSNSGVTGSSPRIRIRGFNSLSQPNNPLMIIDGARVENTTGAAGGNTNVSSYGWTAGAVTSLNPDEIESFEIVKGPAAATLYGTDAANGVIVIRTKRGQQGPASFNFYTEGGLIQGPERWNTNYYAFGKTPTGTATNCVNLARIAGICTLDSVSVWNVMKDAASSPVGTGNRKQAGAQISGGTQQFRYFISGDLERETGYLRLPDVEIARISAERGGATVPDDQIRPNYLRRTSLRGNVSTMVGAKSEFNISNSVQFQKSQIPGTAIFSNAAWGPGYKDAFDGWGGGGTRPGESFAVRSSENLVRMTTSVNGNVTLTPWLTLRATVGVDAGNNFSDNLQRRGEGGTAAAPSLGRRNETRSQTILYSGDLGATASFTLTPSITSRTSVGTQYNRRNRGSVSAIGTNLPPGSSTLAGAATLSNSESTIQSVVAGGYIEEQIGWRDRLFLTGAMRADGASSFGQNFNTAYYPKVSASWLVSSEDFFPESKFLSSLRYRVAYGSSGVQPAADAALARLQLSTVFVNGATQSGARLQALGNPNLKPERTTELETGIDADFWSGRVRFEGTFYQKESEDALVQRAYPRSVGIIGTGQLDNVGAVRNRGVEGTLSAQVFTWRGMSLDLSTNGSINKSKLLKLDKSLRPPEDRFIKFVEGYPLMGQWDRKVRSYSDRNNNGILELSEVVVDDSITFIGVTNPTHLFNVTPTFSLLNGQLRVSSMFVYKGKFIQTNFSELNKCNIGGCRAKNDPKAPMPVQAAFIAFSGPSLTYAGYAEDGTFTRWAEASIVYEAGPTVRRWLGSRRATLSVSARNLKLWTDYRGNDPEVTQNPELTGNFGTLWDLGYDNPVSPQPRSYIIRLTLGL